MRRCGLLGLGAATIDRGLDLDDAYDRGFRCCRCGATRLIDGVEGRLRLTAPRGDTGPACERCGALSWVRMFSTTEFYDFWQRADVCRVGEHVAQGVRNFRMRAPKTNETTSGARSTHVFVQASPEHVEALRSGWGGYELDEDPAPER